MRLNALDAVAAEVIDRAAARPLFLHYQPASAPVPFPAAECISFNDAVVHGIPGPYRLRDGVLVSVDCGAQLYGWSGDAAISLIVGEHPDTVRAAADRALIDTTQRALDTGIAATSRGPSRRHRPGHRPRRPRHRPSHARSGPTFPTRAAAVVGSGCGLDSCWPSSRR